MFYFCYDQNSTNKLYLFSSIFTQSNSMLPEAIAMQTYALLRLEIRNGNSFNTHILSSFEYTSHCMTRRCKVNYAFVPYIYEYECETRRCVYNCSSSPRQTLTLRYWYNFYTHYLTFTTTTTTTTQINTWNSYMNILCDVRGIGVLGWWLVLQHKRTRNCCMIKKNRNFGFSQKEEIFYSSNTYLYFMAA